MSYQYINPYFIPKEYPIINYNGQNQQQPIQNYAITNPYQASFYNQQLIYPYNNPAFQPNVNQKYVSLGSVKSPNNDDIYLYQLKNGHTVALMPKQNVGTIVKTFLNAGSMNESDELRGISHTIEHMLFKGSSKLADGDVFRLTGKMGASTNASTDYAQTDYYITAPYMSDENFDKTIEIQGDMISYPTFSYEALESEKGPIVSEISMRGDYIETAALDDVVRNLFQIDSSSYDVVSGSYETVMGLKTYDLKNHHKKYYAPSEVYTVVVGDFDPNQAMETISNNFNLPTKSQQELNDRHIEELKPIETSVREDLKNNRIYQSQIYMAFTGPKAQNGKDFVILDMIKYYLGSCSTSPLKKTIEKLDGSFDMSSQKVGLKQTDPYALINMLEVNPQDEQKAIDAFYDAVIALQSGKITDEEISILKTNAEKSMQFSECECEDLCNIIGKGLMNGTLNSFSNYKEILQSITREDIQDFMQRCFDLNKVSMVVVHPKDVTNEQIKSNYEASKYSAQNAAKIKNSQISFCGSMPKLSTEDILEYDLKNNTHMILNNSNASDLCCFEWKVNTPPIKPKNPNIPAVLAYMFQKGTNYLNQDELERYEELNGIVANVGVNGRSIDIVASCLPKNAAQTMALLNELMYNPKLTQQDLDDAKRNIKIQLKSSNKDADSNLLDKLYPGFFPTDSAKLKALDELTLDDIKEFYSQLLNSATSNFTAVMPTKKYPFLAPTVFEFQNNTQQVKFKKSINKPSQLFKPNATPSVIYDTDTVKQAQIYKSYQFPWSGNVYDEAKFELLNEVLGGSANARLFADLREKQQLAYSVYSDINSFENTGILTLGIKTTTDNKDSGEQSYDNVQKSLEGFKKHTDKLCSELITDEELESAKTTLKQTLIRQLQHPVYSMGLLSMSANEPLGVKRIDKYVEALDSVTKEDIMQAAQFIFAQKPVVSIVASEDTIKSQMDYLKTQGEIHHA